MGGRSTSSSSGGLFLGSLLLLLLEPLHLRLGHLLLATLTVSSLLLRRGGLMDGKSDTRLMVICAKQGGHPKLLAGALAIGTSDNGGVNVKEPVVVEELMCCVCHGVADAHRGGMNARPGAKVGVGSHVLQGLALLAQRVQLSTNLSALCVATIDCPQALGSGSLQFNVLTRGRTLHHLACDLKRCACASAGLALIKPFSDAILQHTLQIGPSGPIIELNEQETSLVGIAISPGPTGDSDSFTNIGRSSVGQHLVDAGAVAAELTGHHRRRQAMEGHSVCCHFGSCHCIAHPR
mmetsp:Transcript_6083/g.12715  ORF Transcript_6083/g.12715 Transcript_6083/m.12715 type:complete len:293 (+) Transcript_6083:961-1839(+)